MDEKSLNEAASRLERLGEALPAKGRIWIVPHDYPDPDALAAAAGMHLLLAARFQRSSQIVFSGVVSRAENRELLRHFRYAWRLRDAAKTPRRPVSCVVVDSAPRAGNVTLPSFLRPVAVIDHHPLRRRGKPVRAEPFQDIRPDVGATASILYEYLMVAGVLIPRWLASIMAYAIASETRDLARNVTALDVEAYSALVRQGNMAVVGRIRHAPLPRSYYGQLQEALRSARVYGRTAWAHLPAVEQPEIVAEIADLLLRLERTSHAFCSAWQGDRLIFSLRSTRPGTRCGALLRRLVRRQGAAGGHDESAAGQLDLEGLNPAEKEERRAALVRSLVGRLEPRRAASPEEFLPKPLIGAGDGL